MATPPDEGETVTNQPVAAGAPADAHAAPSANMRAGRTVNGVGDQGPRAQTGALRLRSCDGTRASQLRGRAPHAVEDAQLVRARGELHVRFSVLSSLPLFPVSALELVQARDRLDPLPHGLGSHPGVELETGLTRSWSRVTARGWSP